MNKRLILSDEVQNAFDHNAPIVALESTIITHGMPYPQNLKTAELVEQEVRNSGATPATIAVMEGHIHVGLEREQLQKLATSERVSKLSRADMALGLVGGGTGATTVSATMIAARIAGINVFATGGIGGVHRGASESYDVSADLQELAQTPVTVVCSGAKAILDIPKTLELLETQGVSVITYQQDGFPAFWARESGLVSPQRLDSATRIAETHLMRSALGIPGGQLVANPIPVVDEIPLAEMTPFIEQALNEADARQVGQKDVTPFLLGRIFELTNGRSLTANIALVRNNARLAAEIACEMVRLTSAN